MNQVNRQQTSYRTSLYLTKNNRHRLNAVPKGQRTQLISQAIEEKLTALERERVQAELLTAIANIQPVKRDESFEQTIRRARQAHGQAHGQARETRIVFFVNCCCCISISVQI